MADHYFLCAELVLSFHENVIMVEGIVSADNGVARIIRDGADLALKKRQQFFQKKLNFQNVISDKLKKINLSPKSRAQSSHKELSFELWNLCIQKIELCAFCVPRKTRPHQSRLYFLDMRKRQLVQSLGRACAAWKPEVFRSINAQVEA